MNFEQKKNIGFLYVIEKLSPQSGYGKKIIKKISHFSNKNDLEEEYYNLSLILSLFAE